MARIEAVEKLAREICWMEFARPKDVGVTKARYWKQITQSARENYLADARRFVFVLENIKRGLLNEIETIEVSDEEEAAARAAVQPFRKWINETPALTSILYDIDLLPEQIRLAVNASRMIAFCLVFKKLTPEQIENLFVPETRDAG